jgi:LDH2 family malate/lactate/ureidoglycolate dehydrogenase
MSQRIYSYTALYQFALKVFTSIGCSNEDASLATSVLLSADLRGIDSHGIARLVGYVRLWEVGRIKAQPKIQIFHETHHGSIASTQLRREVNGITKRLGLSTEL